MTRNAGEIIVGVLYFSACAEEITLMNDIYSTLFELFKCHAQLS